MTPTFTFNPPTASAMLDSITEPQRSPYELRRVMLGNSMQARMRREITRAVIDGRHVTRHDGPEHYYRPCKRSTSSRSACHNEIEVYKVLTGTTGEDDIPHQGYTYYWPDTAIVVETATSYSIRPIQVGFCSMKCLSLWAAKIARDTES
jgi:hypothetical protein